MTHAAKRPKPEQAMLDQIVAGAERAFLESGYELATMASVARHARVARASVYNNFKGKEALFLAVMRRGVDGFVERALGGDDCELPPLDRLRCAAVTFIRTAIESESLEMYRTVVAQAVRFPELRDTLHNQGLLRIEARFCALAGEAGVCNAAVVAEQLLATLMGGYFGQRLLGVPVAGTPDEYVDRVLRRLLPTSADCSK